MADGLRLTLPDKDSNFGGGGNIQNTGIPSERLPSRQRKAVLDPQRGSRNARGRGCGEDKAVTPGCLLAASVSRESHNK